MHDQHAGPRAFNCIVVNDEAFQYRTVVFVRLPKLPAMPLKPFLKAGVGLAYTKVSDLEVLGETFLAGDSETKPYFCFGGGFEFPMGPAMKLFVEGRMNMIMYSSDDSAISNETVSFMPITVGIKF